MASMTSSALLYAFLGGFLPALLWLWFWLKEDRLHPEPRSALTLTFFGGIIAALLAYKAERFVMTIGFSFVGTLIIWAVIEEVFKFAFAYWTAIRRKVCDEPIDDMIYMLTAALGFAAIENMLFLLAPLIEGDVAKSLITGNLRFIGATLLHIAASSIIGAAGAFYFYRGKKKREVAIFVGLLAAIGLHALFNIMVNLGTQSGLLYALFVAWAAIVIVLAIFEKVKRLKR
jgi:RsiW-degrading membrane proteinase PrsW (M82 family)